jgi:thioredoxin reductase (NADPH)
MSDSTTQKHDLVIVGGGPAGLTAAIYAERALLDTVTLEREALGGQMILTNEVDNYPGTPHTDGFTLTDAMRAQAEDLGATIVMDPVSSIAHDETTGRFAVKGSQGTYDASSVILAAGAHPRLAGFEGEEHYSGHGVSYCATCDGMFYRNKQVFVIGGGNSAAEEAIFLTRFANKVTLIVRKDHLRAQASVIEQLDKNEKIEVRLLTSILKVEGNELPTYADLP